MKIKEIIKLLIETPDYLGMRSTISDDFINFIKEHMHIYWDMIKEKEECYQLLIEACKKVESDDT